MIAQFGGMGDRLRQMASEQGREIVLPDYIPNSRMALEAAEYARQKGKHSAFHNTVFRKFYGERQDLHDWSVLRSAAEEVGLDPDKMEGSTVSGRYKPVVDAITQKAKSMGITAVPAYILGRKYAILGAQPYDVFLKSMAKLKVEGEGGLKEHE